MDDKFFYETELKNLGITFARQFADNNPVQISVNPKLSVAVIKYFDRSNSKERSYII